ncbi:MAG: cytochrome c5 family protein [Betaproteobacteria bacterium]|nr:cytochrome c5 family protein [Betaproteobacteria bacterium]
MTKKNYTLHISVILGATAALLLFIFILVAHHREMPDRVRMDRSVLLATPATVAERIKPVGQISIAGAQTQPAPVNTALAAASPSRDGQQVYQASCLACHDAGIAGAPKLGDKGQWAKRIAKGLATLYASAVSGMPASPGGMPMPAKGGNPALSDAEVKAAVDYMVARAK